MRSGFDVLLVTVRSHRAGLSFLAEALRRCSNPKMATALAVSAPRANPKTGPGALATVSVTWRCGGTFLASLDRTGLLRRVLLWQLFPTRVAIVGALGSPSPIFSVCGEDNDTSRVFAPHSYGYSRTKL